MSRFLSPSRLSILFFALITLVISGVFLFVSFEAGEGKLLMPLDDVYIHFQYARQLAHGEPYVYNPGGVATSGATSLLYPYALAGGYLIGFRDLWLGLWAMLLGAVALCASMVAIDRLCRVWADSYLMSLLIAASFGLTGSMAWHFMSGMETGLMIVFTLWTLLFFVKKRLGGFVVMSTLLALTRPEASVMAVVATLLMGFRMWPEIALAAKSAGQGWRLALLLLPLSAIFVQPGVNLLFTGSAVASGTQAKSLLAVVPQDWGLILQRIWENFNRMWMEFFTGFDGREGRGWYLPILLGPLAISGIIAMLFKRSWFLTGLLLMMWLLVMSAAIATLDTAFWHFKRYQAPLMALFFPVAAWALTRIAAWFSSWQNVNIRRVRLVSPVFSMVIAPIFSVFILIQFVQYHYVNVRYVYQQPYQMALWLQENTPPNALIAVHDVGLMRYVGGRNTLDMVGLTTPGAANYWRNGPGSVAEFLFDSRPDYIASYGRGHGYGLAYLEGTLLYENQLAAFPVEDWQRHLNVALAADFQGIYQPDWTKLNTVAVTSEQVVDVAALRSEAQHDYLWQSAGTGFASEVYEFNQITDAVRRIGGVEEFTIATGSTLEDEASDSILVTRVLAQHSGKIDIYIDDIFLDSQWIPFMPGQWFAIRTVIPPQLQAAQSHIRIVPQMDGGDYLPAQHHTEEFRQVMTCCRSSEELAIYQDGHFALNAIIDHSTSEMLDIEYTWIADGETTGDYRFFVHLYDDLHLPPVLQWDDYFAGMPVGNWHSGHIQDRIRLDIADLSPGTYQLAIGFYNPQTNERLMPLSDVYEVAQDGRLWLGEVEAPGEVLSTLHKITN